MDLYTSTSYEMSERITTRYSTSFSMSSRLFVGSIRPHVYAIYGLVRIADEIVDTYGGNDTEERLHELQAQTMEAIKSHYSTNPVIHAFADTAIKYDIGESLIAPFFESMRMDLRPQHYDTAAYEQYIYGSAEVIGLMCLKVFVNGNADQYGTLAPGAQSLGDAYQKVNFLRDIKTDYTELGRTYFPGITYETFSDHDKQLIIADIKKDFLSARQSIDALPKHARRAVRASYYYYAALLRKLDRTPAKTISSGRIRISNIYKVLLLMKAALGL